MHSAHLCLLKTAKNGLQHLPWRPFAAIDAYFKSPVLFTDYYLNALNVYFFATNHLQNVMGTHYEYNKGGLPMDLQDFYLKTPVWGCILQPILTMYKQSAAFPAFFIFD